MPEETWGESEASQYEADGYKYFQCEKCGVFVHVDYLKTHICKEWWELLIWENMNQTWDMLSDALKNKIREKGLAPSYDSCVYTNIR